MTLRHELGRSRAQLRPIQFFRRLIGKQLRSNRHASSRPASAHWKGKGDRVSYFILPFPQGAAGFPCSCV